MYATQRSYDEGQHRDEIRTSQASVSTQSTSDQNRFSMPPRSQRELVYHRTVCIVLLALGAIFVLILLDVFVGFDALIAEGMREHKKPEELNNITTPYENFTIKKEDGRSTVEYISNSNEIFQVQKPASNDQEEANSDTQRFVTYYKDTSNENVKKSSRDDNTFSERTNEDNRRNYSNEFVETRTKRHVKIHLVDYIDSTLKSKQTSTPKPNNTKKDDDLYVEIETHYNGNNKKSEKKKLIESLVGKIEKAIQSSEKESKIDNSEKFNIFHINKRQQDEFNRKIIQETSMGGLKDLPKRLLDPLYTIKRLDYTSRNDMLHRSKNRNLDIPKRRMDVLNDIREINYNKPNSASSNTYRYSNRNLFFQPKFLEMDKVSVNFDESDGNNVPQRLVKPLINEIDDFSKRKVDNNFNTANNMKLTMKDVDGTGFSVGINQYQDDSPDPQSINMFTNLENLIRSYTRKYDTISNEYQQMPSDVSRTVFKREAKHYTDDILAKDVFHHDSIHGNSKKYVPTSLLKEVQKRKIDKYKKISRHRQINLSNIVRLKRSMQINNKVTKINKYINTNRRTMKHIYLKPLRNQRDSKDLTIMKVVNRRNKREVKNIPAISSQNVYMTNSEESIFESVESVYPDRAIINTKGFRDTISKDIKDNEPFYSYETPSQPLPVLKPLTLDTPYRHNSLSSKYPHILLEEMARSIERKLENSNEDINMPQSSTPSIKIDVEEPTSKKPKLNEELKVANTNDIPGFQDILKVLYPTNDFKITFKVLPNNKTDTLPQTGFKEIHTSVNKTFHKDGLRFSTLVNVSQISKIEKDNSTPVSRMTSLAPNILTEIKTQHDAMQKLINEHKQMMNSHMKHLQKQTAKIDNAEITKDKTVPFIRNLNQENNIKIPKKELVTKVPEKFLETSTAHNQILTTEKPLLTTTMTSFFKPLDVFIEKNMRLTKDILRKIDKNTELLASFLDKIISMHKHYPNIKIKNSDLEEEITKSERQLIEKKEVHETTPLRVETTSVSTTKEMKTSTVEPQNPVKESFLIGPHIKSLDLFNHNETKDAIPFVYAYQNPNPSDGSKFKPPIKNLIYHGHIHTNTDKLLRFEEREHSNMHFIDDPEYFTMKPRFLASASPDVFPKKPNVNEVGGL